MKVQQFQYFPKTGWEKDFFSMDHETRSQLILVFWGSKYIQNAEVFEQLRKIYTSAHIVFVSTAGEIKWDEVFDDSIAITTIFFEKSSLQIQKAEIQNISESYEVGKKLGKALEKENLKHVLTFSDGLKVSGTELIKGIYSEFPEYVTMSGGLAGDGDDFVETFTSLDEVPGEKKYVILIGLYGDHLQVGSSSIGGWNIFGPKRLVTRSQGSTVYELDRKPILDLYKLYLWDLAKNLPGSWLLFPLSISQPGSETSLVRTLLAINEWEKSITFAGDIPEWNYAQLMRANFWKLISGAGKAAEYSFTQVPRPQLAMLVSCVGRKIILKQRIENELEAIQDIIWETCPITGFYSYGEIGSLADNISECQFHNQTMTVTLLSEK